MARDRIIAEQGGERGWIAWFEYEPGLRGRATWPDLAVCRLLDRRPRPGLSFDELTPDWPNCRDGHVEWIPAVATTKRGVTLQQIASAD